MGIDPGLADPLGIGMEEVGERVHVRARASEVAVASTVEAVLVPFLRSRHAAGYAPSHAYSAEET